MQDERREQVYSYEEYYWGTEPNELAKQALEFILAERSPPELTVIDIGAGEGRDAVFFAEQGLNVYATDVSSAGLAKAQRLADERDVQIEMIEADANSIKLPESVDVVYSIGAVQYIEPENRQQQFNHFQKQTTAEGLHVIFAFIDHPDLEIPPDWTANEYFYEPGELEAYYCEWEILDFEELVFEDDSGDEPHKHAAEVLIAKKSN